MAESTYQCDIVTPEKSVYAGQVHFVAVPGTGGEMGILDRHAPTVSTLKPGAIRIKADEGASEPTDLFVVSGGYVQIGSGRVTVLADRAARVSDIDKEQVAARIADLEQQLGGMAEDDPKRAFTDALLKWEEVKLNAVQS